MIGRLLPETWAHTAEAYCDLAGVLYPAEEASVVRAVERRRREFTTVRVLARAALQPLGYGDVPVPRGAGGRPQWPQGIVGSMTHCEGYRAVAVATERDVAGLGIDAEPDGPLPSEVLAMIASATEQIQGRAPVVEHWGRLLFCAKEAVYKVWFPLTGQRLDFSGVEVWFHPDGRFTARLLEAGLRVGGVPVTSMDGRWLQANGFLMTAVVLQDE